MLWDLCWKVFSFIQRDIYILHHIYIYTFTGESELSSIEVGRFNNCADLASLILKRRQFLVPRSILKRGSFRVKTVEPIIVTPPQLPIPVYPEILEFVTYV